MRLAFQSADSVKQIALPNAGRYHPKKNIKGKIVTFYWRNLTDIP